MERLDRTAAVVLGNQLFKNNPALLKYPEAEVIMIEADNIFSKRNYHKHKIMLIMLAMRNYRDYLNHKKYKLNYVEHKKSNNFSTELKRIITSKKITKLVWVRSADKTPNLLMQSICSRFKIEFEIIETEQFITPYSELREFFSSHKSPIMDNFYRWQRKRMGILMDGDKPQGGQWSYDSQNRKPLPKQITIPALLKLKVGDNFKDVAGLINKCFKNNPGSVESFWLPTNFNEANDWLEDFIVKRFSNFGAYEDAMKDGEAFLFHSVLSPLLNIGLLTPAAVIEKADEYRKKHEIPLNSFEGFIRQIIGWREYMYGMYEFNEDQIRKNFFGFKKKLEPYWYKENNTEFPLPVSSVLNTTFKYGYNHHIERLMVLGNWFLLNEYDPESVYDWFSSMYVDAYEWVMVPNVFAMSQYADGGFLATKPYISGGNYLQKMGKWWGSNEEAKSSEFTELYWRFIKKHADKFKNNPRMSLAVNQARKR
jgi:deoxyribodipyrimidine photolyase-related protein